MDNDDSMFYKDLGERITQLRKDAKITQSQLADRLKVSQQMVAAFENGTRRVSVSHLIQIANILFVSPDEFLVPGEGRKKRGPDPQILRQLEKVRELPQDEQKKIDNYIQDLWDKYQFKKQLNKS